VTLAQPGRFVDLHRLVAGIARGRDTTRPCHVKSCNFRNILIHSIGDREDFFYGE